ncbi:GNAT family N-acetyltransferase [Paenibacillus zanthoxyli]|uniref:GNAT family N-acetyltransferase n=1 Tax=Paenibacillus zanthoxyli TaxID=369399 RepID=UPI00046FEF5E|nr:GNAT family N-acetyltransferase [Paenibacillus zanthoxyli]
MTDNILLVDRKPSVKEYLSLRKAVEFQLMPEDSVARGLDNSLFAVCAASPDRIVGMARVIGDGGTCFYVQDVLVLPEFQGRGLGARIMERIMDYIGKNACQSAVVGLMSTKGLEHFYERYGFWKRPTEQFGNGMIQFWGEAMHLVKDLKG